MAKLTALLVKYRRDPKFGQMHAGLCEQCRPRSDCSFSVSTLFTIPPASSTSNSNLRMKAARFFGSSNYS